MPLASGDCVPSSLSWLTERVLEGHTAHVRAVAFSPDGSLVASGGEDKTVRITETESGNLHYRLRNAEAINGLAWDPLGQYILVTTEEGTILMLSRGTSTWKRKVVYCHQARLYGCALSNDGTLFAAGCDDDRTLLLDVGVGFAVHQSIEGFSYAVTRVAFSADGTLLAAGEGVSGCVSVFSRDPTTLTWTRVALLRHHTEGIETLCFSPVGTHLLSGGQDDTAALWSVPTSGAAWACEPSVVFRGHYYFVRGGAITSDGKYAITASQDETVRVWAVANGEEVAHLKAKERIHSLAFHPTTGLLCAGLAYSHGVELWRLTTRVRVSLGQATPDEARRLADLDAALQDGVRSLTSSQISLWLEDGNARVLQSDLDGINGEALREVTAHDLTQRGVSFDAACRLLLAAYMAEHKVGEPPLFPPPRGLLGWGFERVNAWLGSSNPLWNQRLSGAALSSLSVAACKSFGISASDAVAIVARMDEERAAEVRDGKADKWTMSWSATRPLVAQTPP